MSDLAPSADSLAPDRSNVRPRAILLGASNLTMGFGSVINLARRSQGPLDVVAAHGHGRSYGQASRVLGRQLPGITQSGLWPALADAPPAPTVALVTDIGNDILYEAPVAQIAGWIEHCLDRLAAVQARTVVTLLPLCNLESISRFRFHVARRLFVPRCGLSLADVARRAIDLNERVRGLATARAMMVVEPRERWYGVDPLHFRLTRRSEAWTTILGGWSDGDEARPASRWPSRESLYLRMLRPQRRAWLGLEQVTPQPAGRLRDGSTVSLY
jgi:hypothetical protein